MVYHSERIADERLWWRFQLAHETEGFIGSITVSGLPSVDDHRFVVREFERFIS